MSPVARSGVKQGAFKALCCLEGRGQEELCMTLSLSNLARATHTERASQVALGVKNPPADAEDIGNVDSIPGSGRCPGGGHGNPLRYSCLESPMDRGAWQATVHGVAKSRTRLN